VLLKQFIRGFVECEVSIELIRQRIQNQMFVKPNVAFNAIDSDSKGYLTIEDLREFLKQVNMYPIEKNLSLLYKRLDKDEDGVVAYDEFVTGIRPFLEGIKQE
jgi:Ca2+-binding EF-hand superfamily protein